MISFIKLFLVSACLNAFSFFSSDLKEPEDYKDVNRYNFGSLWKNKDEDLKKMFGSKKDSKSTLQKKVECSEEKAKVWKVVMNFLKDYNLEYVDKTSGEIRTERTKIKEFDQTESCEYVISVKINDKGKFFVDVLSDEDSKSRLKKHSLFVKSEIEKLLKK